MTTVYEKYAASMAHLEDELLGDSGSTVPGYRELLISKMQKLSANHPTHTRQYIYDKWIRETS
tara:strand:- start:1489 stop:1677 length:189 start_codon:yes stop_codon:yes gene_type:complete